MYRPAFGLLKLLKSHLSEEETAATQLLLTPLLFAGFRGTFPKGHAFFWRNCSLKKEQEDALRRAAKVGLSPLSSLWVFGTYTYFRQSFSSSTYKCFETFLNDISLENSLSSDTVWETSNFAVNFLSVSSTVAFKNYKRLSSVNTVTTVLILRFHEKKNSLPFQDDGGQSQSVRCSHGWKRLHGTRRRMGEGGTPGSSMGKATEKGMSWMTSFRSSSAVRKFE